MTAVEAVEQRVTRDLAGRQPGAAPRGPPAAARRRAATSTTSVHGALRRRSSAARTRTPGSSTSTSPARSTSTGWSPIYTYEDLAGRVAEPLPLLIPHPALHAAAPATRWPTGWCNHVGEPVVMVVADDRYLAEDARRPDPRRVRGPAGRGRRRAAPARATTRCTTTSRTTSRRTWCRRSATPPAAIAAAPHVLELDLTIERSCVDAVGGQGGATPAGTPTTGRCGSTRSTQTSTSVRAAHRRQARPAGGRRSRWSPPTSAAASA